jgi:eukaryotic-like serine/threonine-protein kinase
VVSLDGRQTRQITNDPERDRIPRWSPDGARILFYSDRGGNDYQVWSIRPDGGDRRPMTAVTGDKALDSLWSPDGKRLLTLLGDAGPTLIDVSVPLDRRRPQPLPHSREGDELFMPTSWSADGRWLVGEVQAVTRRTGRLGIARYSLDAGHYEKLTASGSIPVWMPDGRIVYIDGGGLFLFDPATRASRELLAPPANTNSEFKMVAVSRDGRTLVLLRASDEGDIKLLRLLQ